MDVAEVRSVVERVFALPEVLEACSRRDLGTVVEALMTHGVTQGKMSELTGIPQGRLSNWKQGMHTPRATSVFEKFADGLGMPGAARQALGLAPAPPAGPVTAADSVASAGSLASAGSVLPGGSGRGGVPAAEAVPGARQPALRVPADPAAAGVPRLRGLDGVRGELGAVMAALEAEQVRAEAEPTVRRRVWKNLVFTGGPGSGKSRAAAAVGQSYRKLGVLSSGRVQQMAAGDLVGSGPEETGKLVSEAFKLATGGVLLVNGAHAWERLPDRGDQVLRRVYENLSEYRDALAGEVAVILAGDAGPLRRLLDGSPPLAARFRAVIDFPGYSPAHLAVVFSVLADEAGCGLPLRPRPGPWLSWPEPRGSGRRGTRGSRSRC